MPIGKFSRKYKIILGRLSNIQTNIAAIHPVLQQNTILNENYRFFNVNAFIPNYHSQNKPRQYNNNGSVLRWQM